MSVALQLKNHDPESVPRVYSFSAVTAKTPKTLILGSMPGEQSLQQNQYYAHPRNSFWPILCAIYQQPLVDDYKRRLLIIKNHHLALWDVLHYCRRRGSLDTNIQDDDVRANKLPEFLDQYSSISSICFNGQKACQLFKRHILSRAPEIAASHRLQVLPSTSPAHASLSMEDKLTVWRQHLHE